MKLLKAFTIVCVFSFASACFIGCMNQANAENNHPGKMANSTFEWHHITDIKKLQEENSKPVIVDVYTDWCKWCKVMDEKTFSDPSLQSYLAENYHMIKFDAETKEDLQFNGKSFSFVQSGRRGINSLASHLCQGRASYPSFVILDKDLNIVEVIRGFKEVDKFKAILNRQKT